jgi:hypothetical protein
VIIPESAIIAARKCTLTSAGLTPQALGACGAPTWRCESLPRVAAPDFEFTEDMNLSILRQALSKNKATPVLWSVLHESLCVITPALLFLCFFNVHTLDPTRIGWVLQNDWGQHSLGWNAFRHEPWSTFNHESLLGAPTGLSVIYTDSNPLFAFIFRPWTASFRPISNISACGSSSASACTSSSPTSWSSRMRRTAGRPMPARFA